VTNYEGKPVEKADVTMAVKTAIQAVNSDNGTSIVPTYPDENLPHELYKYPGLLCEAAKPSHCSDSSVTDMMTDKNGQVQVVFWGPGVIQQATETFLASAQGDVCGHSSCVLQHGQHFGEATILPHQIYQTSPTSVPIDTEEELAAWVEDNAPSSHQGVKLTNGLLKVFNKYLEGQVERTYWENAIEETRGIALADASSATLKTVGKLGLITEIALALLELNDARVERNGWASDFLENVFQVHTLGLGTPGWKDFLTVPFTSSLVDAMVGFDPDGLLVQYGELITRLADENELTPEKVQLTVLDVSYCDDNGALCGPGYTGPSGYRLSGIQPYLDLVLSTSGMPLTQGDYGGPLSGGIVGSIVIPYQANVWRTIQPGLSQ
jgi:hypothetical protein